MMTSVCPCSEPRIRTAVKVPIVPERWTATPGTSRNRSDTVRACLRSISSAVMTVTELPTALACCGTRLADTTISGSCSMASPTAGVFGVSLDWDRAAPG